MNFYVYERVHKFSLSLGLRVGVKGECEVFFQFKKEV